MRYYLGIDVGSYFTKAVLIDEGGSPIARASRESGLSFQETANTLKQIILESAGVNEADVARIAATGVGRDNVSFASLSITEITSLARGVFHFFSLGCTVIDIGGEDIKIVEVRGDGGLGKFSMNRKCAAGTGAFLDEIARRLKMEISNLHQLAEKATKSVELNSFCTVFAGTEVIHLIREGTPIEMIARGAYEALVSRIISMARISNHAPVVLTGGVIEHNPLLARLFEEKTGIRPLVPPHPQYVVALGAALIAKSTQR